MSNEFFYIADGKKDDADLHGPILDEGSPSIGLLMNILKEKGVSVDPSVFGVERNRMAWEPYEGPRGGYGWINKATSEVRYQQEKPTERQRSEDPEPEGQENRDASAKSLHEKYPDKVTVDNSNHNYIWIDAKDDKAIRPKLLEAGAVESNSKPGMFRIKNKTSNANKINAVLGGADFKGKAKFTGKIGKVNKAKMEPGAMEGLVGTLFDGLGIKKKPKKPDPEPVAEDAADSLFDAEPEAASESKSTAAGVSDPITQEKAQEILSQVSKITGFTPSQVIASIKGDASPKNSYSAKVRAAVESAVLEKGLYHENAIVQYHKQLHDSAESSKHATDIANSGHKRVGKEFALTPLYDLQILSKISGEVPGFDNSVCYMSERSIKMGKGRPTGDYRHELGHAIHASIMGSYTDKQIKKHYQGVIEKANKNPAGKHKKLSYDFYEDEYGIIGKRGLDNDKEDFAEHYRGYHREVYRELKENGSGNLAKYRKRHPEMAALFDARYTVAAMAKLL